METIKILFFSANTMPQSRYLNIEEEYHQIEAKIRASEYRDRLQLIPAFAARPDDWLQQLNQHHPHIVQFSGHGSKEGSLFMIGSLGSVGVRADTLKRLFTTLKDNVRLIVFNACYSQTHAQAVSEVIDCVIGMNTAITDEAAIKFIASLYSAIGFGRSIQDAFEQGKLSIEMNGILEENTPELLVKSGVDAANIALLPVPDPSVRSTSRTVDSITSDSTTSPTIDPDTVSIFISYAPQDIKWRDALVTHLSPMKRLGLISIWYEQNTRLGTDKESVVDQHLEASRIILLLVSPAYFASDKIYQGQLQRALARQKAGTARVIPILIRDTSPDWKDTDFGKLQGLPRDDRSIQGWKDTDAALAVVASEIRRVVNELRSS